MPRYLFPLLRGELFEQEMLIQKRIVEKVERWIVMIRNRSEAVVNDLIRGDNCEVESRLRKNNRRGICRRNPSLIFCRNLITRTNTKQFAVTVLMTWNRFCLPVFIWQAAIV